jgi:hypothetical protein
MNLYSTQTPFNLTSNYLRTSPINLVTPIGASIQSARKLSTELGLGTYETLSLGDIVPVNANNDHSQTDSSICVLGNNSTLVTYTSNALDRRYSTIATRTFTANLDYSSDEMFFSTNYKESLEHSNCAPLSFQKYVVVYDNSDDVFMNISSQDEPTFLHTQINTLSASYQTFPDVTVGLNNSIYTVWDSRFQGIFGQNFYENGTSDSHEFAITASENSQEKPSITVLSDSSISYGYTCKGDSLFDICDTIVDHSGNKESEFIVNSNRVSSQLDSRQAALNERHAFTWIDKGAGSVVTTVLNNDGTNVCNDITVSSNYIDINSRPDIAAVSGGNGYGVVYGTHKDGGYHAYLQMYDDCCETVGSTIEITDGAQSVSTRPRIGLQQDGTIIVSFSGDDAEQSGVFLRTLTPDSNQPLLNYSLCTPAPTIQPSNHPTITGTNSSNLSANENSSSSDNTPWMIILIATGVSALALALLTCLCCRK